MKSTRHRRTEVGALQSAARLDRWKALPFLTLVFSSTLPLNLKLEESRPLMLDDMAAMTSQATDMANSGNSILFVVFLAALYLISGCIVLQKPKLFVLLLARQWPVLAITLLIAASITWSYYPEKVLMNSVHSVGALLVIMAAVLRYRHDPWLLPKQLSYVLGVSLMVHIGAVLLLPSYAIDWQGRWQGLTTHPNTFGALAFVTLWANSAVLICKRPERLYPHIFFGALAILAMLGANSVTSLVTSFCSVATILAMRKLWQAGARRNFQFGMIFIAFASAILAAIVVSQIDLSWLFEMLGRDSNFTGRNTVWEDGLAAILRRPTLGWSFDDHSYLIATEGMPYPTYHNGLLDLGVSGGLAAIFIFICLLTVWTWQFTSRRVVAKETILFSVAFVVGFLVHNVTEASLWSPRNAMWEIFCLLVLLGACNRPRQAGGEDGVPKSRSHYRAPVYADAGGALEIEKAAQS